MFEGFFFWDFGNGKFKGDVKVVELVMFWNVGVVKLIIL